MDTQGINYLNQVISILKKIEDLQTENINAAADLIADAIGKDELIHVYGGGGHTTLVMGEMFFRAGGLANINPIMEPGLSVFNQALKYLELERTANYGRSIVKYFRIKKDEVVIIFHNIGINAATIDAAMEVKESGAKLIAVSSSFWQNEMPKDHFLRHPNKKNLFDYADVCIDDYNPVGDAALEIIGLNKPVAPVSNVVDFYIAHRIEIAAIQKCLARGIEPPIWSSANTPGGDEANKHLIDKYLSRVKYL